MDIRLIFALLLLTGPFARAVGEVYRWTDANGQVHYGDVAPTDRKAQPIETRDALDVHGAGPARPDAAATSAAPMDPAQPAPDSTRRSSTRAPSDDENALAQARRRCEAQRRVDCDTHPDADAYADGYPVWLPHRRIVRPVLPPQRPRPSQGNEASAPSAPTHLMRGPAPRPNALR